MATLLVDEFCRTKSRLPSPLKSADPVMDQYAGGVLEIYAPLDTTSPLRYQIAALLVALF